MNSKKIIDAVKAITVSIIIMLAFVSIIYPIFFDKHFKAQSVISEIETLKVDSIKETNYISESYYEFWIGGKYKIDHHITNSVPFKSESRQEVFVRDIEGEILLTFDTKYSTFNCWESDYIRLIKYLKKVEVFSFNQRIKLNGTNTN